MVTSGRSDAILWRAICQMTPAQGYGAPTPLRTRAILRVWAHYSSQQLFPFQPLQEGKLPDANDPAKNYPGGACLLVISQVPPSHSSFAGTTLPSRKAYPHSGVS